MKKNKIKKLKIEKNQFFLACHVVVAGLPILTDAAKARLYVWLILEICCAFIALWKCKKEKKNKTKQKIHVEKSSLNLCCHFFLSRLSSWCGHCRLYFSASSPCGIVASSVFSAVWLWHYKMPHLHSWDSFQKKEKKENGAAFIFLLLLLLLNFLVGYYSI